MKLILLNERLATEPTTQLIRRAHELGLDGYDICVRPGYPVEPGNVEARLPLMADAFRKQGISLSMVTTRPDLVDPDEGDVAPLLRAMGRADIRLLKVGYFRLPRASRLDYTGQIAAARAKLARWEKKGRKFGIRICYHQHSSTDDYFLGSNAAALLDLLNGFDPKFIGANLDAGHLALEGEPFDLAVAIVREYLAIVSLNDVNLKRSDAASEMRSTSGAVRHSTSGNIVCVTPNSVATVTNSTTSTLCGPSGATSAYPTWSTSGTSAHTPTLATAHETLSTNGAR
jgi:sugar phosphate isomerase/epimerase